MEERIRVTQFFWSLFLYSCATWKALEHWTNHRRSLNLEASVPHQDVPCPLWPLAVLLQWGPGGWPSSAQLYWFWEDAMVSNILEFWPYQEWTENLLRKGNWALLWFLGSWVFKKCHSLFTFLPLDLKDSVVPEIKCTEVNWHLPMYCGTLTGGHMQVTTWGLVSPHFCNMCRIRGMASDRPQLQQTEHWATACTWDTYKYLQAQLLNLTWKSLRKGCVPFPRSYFQPRVSFPAEKGPFLRWDRWMPRGRDRQSMARICAAGNGLAFLSETKHHLKWMDDTTQLWAKPKLKASVSKTFPYSSTQSATSCFATPWPLEPLIGLYFSQYHGYFLLFLSKSPGVCFTVRFPTF